jgi:hypothetical protein
MQTQTKHLLIKTMDEAGHGLARLADLTQVDHDGDTYTPGAFSWKEGGEQWCPMLPAHDRMAMPIGKARVYEEGGVAYAELHLNLDTQAGKEWHASLKFDLATGRPAQEWSYGFSTIDAVDEQRGRDRVRNLKRVDVHEVSPVVRGAGVGTATLMMKSHGSLADQLDQVIEALEDVAERAGDVASLRQAEGRPMSKARREQLSTIKTRIETLLGKAAACAKCGGTELDAKGHCKSCGTAVETDGKSRSEDALAAEALAAERMTVDYLTRGARKRLGQG